MKAAIVAVELLLLAGCGSMEASLLDARNETTLDVGLDAGSASTSVDGGSLPWLNDGGMCPLDGGFTPSCLPASHLPVPGCTWAARCCEEPGASEGILCHDWYNCSDSPPQEVSFWAAGC